VITGPGAYPATPAARGVPELSRLSRAWHHVRPGWNDIGEDLEGGADIAFKASYGIAAAATAAVVALGAKEAVAAVTTGVQWRVAIHSAHHSFGRLGRLPHVQVNWWKAGAKGSGGVFRIPLPKGFPWF
jgi:hypothetical protein